MKLLRSQPSSGLQRHLQPRYQPTQRSLHHLSHWNYVCCSGLENVFHLTQRKKSELLIDMEDFEGNKSYVHYTSFCVGPESDGYRLHLTGITNGGAGDSLSHISGQKFSTFDKDQDTWEKNCAQTFIAGFWFSDCHSANPNGVYRWGADNSLYAIGVEWISWKGRGYSLKAISMKIRPVQ
ncbi:hypothetical protein XENOCAPTIV_005280 [Xenoophorus captivus]|uniref:Fibrinogen C-terminal domain-containing protein n=1 Tax=Xenoophorus captivus TaxID=1517983 RepID=A0ABV0R708_9TELE